MTDVDEKQPQQRDHYLPGVPCWIDTEQLDPEAAAAFYGGLFGWQFEDVMPAGAPGRYLIGRLDRLVVAAIGSSPPDHTDAIPTWNTYVSVERADAAAADVARLGGTIVVEPVDVGEAGRMAVVTDPSGAEVRLWQAGRRIGAELVNAPGSWNFNELHTSDVEGAVPFYGALFGWEAATVDVGGDSATMWRRPGYGDDLARQDPGLRARLGEFEAPPGFEDCVGWLMALDPPTAPSHWAVTFSVDDTDAVAARALELGAAVLVEPLDAGPVRMAVLADPAGDVFTVGHFDPAAPST